MFRSSCWDCELSYLRFSLKVSQIDAISTVCQLTGKQTRSWAWVFFGNKKSLLLSFVIYSRNCYFITFKGTLQVSLGNFHSHIQQWSHFSLWSLLKFHYYNNKENKNFKLYSNKDRKDWKGDKYKIIKVNKSLHIENGQMSGNLLNRERKIILKGMEPIIN